MGRTTLKQIEELINKWEYPQALVELGGYLRKSRRSQKAMELLTNVFGELSDSRAAYETTDILTELYPKRGEYWGEKTMYASSMGDVDKVITATEDFIPIAEEGQEISPEKEYEEFYRIILDTLIQNDRFDEAEALFDRLFSRYESNEKVSIELIFDRATYYYQKGELKKALDKCISISDTYPDKRMITLNLSLCYQQLGQLKKAIKVTKDALKVDDWWKYYGRLSQLYIRSQDKKSALENIYLSLEKMEEGTEENIAELGENTIPLIEAHLFKEVTYFTESVWEKYNKSVIAIRNLVNAYAIFYTVLDKKLKEKATKYIKQLIELSEEHKEHEVNLKSIANNALGIIEIEKGDREEGWRLFKKSIELDPGNLDPVENIIDYSKNEREYKDSLELLRKYHSSLEIGLDIDERFIRLQDKLISKLKNECLRTQAINIRLSYENKLFENRMKWSDSREIYYREMKKVVHESLLKIKGRAVGNG